ncbi:hypothetical protein BK120_18885 [Paenibacillus sp. FSL A5-0031]|nr:hypothetical protein BK120_18885 [Paenibacillus sp. FSL A5-0031]
MPEWDEIRNSSHSEGYKLQITSEKKRCSEERYLLSLRSLTKTHSEYEQEKNKQEFKLFLLRSC